MPTSSPLPDLSATELRRLIGAREVSPVEVLDACLERLNRHNPTLNAVVTLNERARDDARDLERRLQKGETPGLLCGLPVGIKDVTPVKGLRTTFGSTLYENFVPAEDALVVQRLRAAGAVILGKTNTPEFAAGGNTFNDVFGRTRNPWNPALSAGGSTGGGCAALAAGMIALGEGTDLGGSLRIPASFCGVVGIRPSVGLVPTHPSDWVWDDMQVTGPVARTAEDLGLMLQAVAGPSPLAPITQPTAGRDFAGAVRAGIKKGLRVAYCPDIAAIGVDPGVQRVCRDAIAALAKTGVTVEEIPFDLAYGRPVYLALPGLWLVTHLSPRLDNIDPHAVHGARNVKGVLRFPLHGLARAEAARGCN